MDVKFADHLKEGVRVAVYMGAAVASAARDIYDFPPIVTTGTVLGPVGPPYNGPDLRVASRYWVDVDIAQGETLPQMYLVEEIIGFLMPMAHVERSEDGHVITGTLPRDYVGP